MDLALANAGETTNGNSPYETELLNKLNRVHFSLVAGGTIALGKDATVEIDETWPWAKAKRPLVLELLPSVSATVTLTLDSENGTFSSAPQINSSNVSLAGWFFSVAGKEGTYRIASHTSGATAFEIDASWPLSSVSGGTATLFKLDYDLTPSYIVIDSSNNKLQFQESAGVTLTATLTAGSYSPSALATEVQTQLNTTGGTPVYTVTYSAVTKKFTIASDRGGAAVFVLVGTGDQSLFSAHKTLGFDDENTTNAASVVSTYILGGIARLGEPMKALRGGFQDICGVDSEAFAREFPLVSVMSGTPDRFTVIAEDSDGSLRVRFNRYPSDKMRVEVPHVPVPRDLKDSSSSIPLVPRKHADVLEDAATFYIMLLKNDDRAQSYAALVQGKLTQMISQHRGQLMRTGENFGSVIPRLDMTTRKRNLFTGEPY